MTIALPDDRHEALRPYLEKLSRLGEAGGGPDSPVRVNVGGESFQIDPWEREALLDSLRDSQPRGTQRWRTLLAQGVALRAKTLTDVQRLERRGGDDERLLDELQLDATIGFALLDELQRAVDQAVVAGDMEQANRLTQFRNKLSRGMDGLEPRLGAARLDEARTLSGALVALPDHRKGRGAAHRREGPATPEAAQPGAGASPPAGEEAARIEALVKLEEELLRRQRDRQVAAPEPAAPPVAVAAAAPRPRRRSRGRILLATLATLLGVWLAMVVWPSIQRSRMPVYTARDFGDLPQIVHVVARPPSLFVTVDAEVWETMGPPERMKVVETVGRRLSVAGYSGAHFKDSDGRTVGQWLRQSGSKLVPAGPAR